MGNSSGIGLPSSRLYLYQNISNIVAKVKKHKDYGYRYFEISFDQVLSYLSGAVYDQKKAEMLVDFCGNEFTGELEDYEPYGCHVYEQY